MSSESIITHVTPVGGNIFADLGFEPEEAAKLLAESHAIIAQKLADKQSVLAEMPEDLPRIEGWDEIPPVGLEC